MKVLVAPLDWGLGHTTRCIPIIYNLLEKGVEVILAGNATQQKVLSAEFPECTFLDLPGYNIKYGKNRGSFVFKMLQQVPKMLLSIWNEHYWLKHVVNRYQIDGIISDNRFGLFHKSIPTVFITHQLNIQTGAGQLADRAIQKMNYYWISKFRSCWIPDYEGDKNLAGVLSHPAKTPKVLCSYIGALSRLSIGDQSNDKEPVLLFVLSGPEPQRSIFEDLVFEQLKHFEGEAIVVRGLPCSKRRVAPRNNVLIYDHLSKKELEPLIRKAQVVICRSGYSSVMDINAIRAKAILVPTPGQTEQEFLGAFLAFRGFAPSFKQEQFDLQAALKMVKSFSYSGFVAPQPELLDRAVMNFVAKLKQP